MTSEIEMQSKEIVEKLERIKALEEEMGRKEDAFQQLQQLFDEQKIAFEVPLIYFSYFISYKLSSNPKIIPIIHALIGDV